MHNPQANKVLFLFRELAGYFISCVEQFSASTSSKVEVVYWPVNAQAPLELKAENGIEWIPKKDWNKAEAILKDRSGDYDCVVVSGWGDVDYNEFVKAKGKSKKVLAFDTQFNNSFRMLFGSLWMRWRLKSYYDAAWVPGERQVKLAKALGFTSEAIATGFYVADLKGIGISSRESDTDLFRIGFVSRLVSEKGFPDVLLALMHPLNLHPNWRVHVWGTGPLMDALPHHDQITYHGFTQPHELKNVWSKLDVFVLASRYEPWGVVVHEAAGAGLPMIVTSAVGAADLFVEQGKNGWVVPVDDYQAICKWLLELDEMSLEVQKKMRSVSLEKASKIDAVQWCNTLQNWMR
jgi:glycosyltransferase involved in cell wall biosynthesis